MERRRWPIFVMVVGIFPMICGCDPCNATFEDVEPAERYRTSEQSGTSEGGQASGRKEALRVVTWNIKHAGGRIRFFYECPGDRVVMQREEVVSNLRGIAEAITELDPDILLLQEVDVDARRTAGVDQLQWLLDHTPLSHGVYASQWRANYIPRHGIGRMDSGNAILSHWPIREATRLALPLISTQNFLVQYFYLKRNILKARLEIPGFGSLHVLNTHLAAFSQDGTRGRQLAELEEEMRALDEEGHRFVAGGDLNLLPPGTEVTGDFADVRCEKEDFEGADYTGTLDLLSEAYSRWEPAIPLEQYRRDNGPHLTYTGDSEVGWTRKLDYLFTNADVRDGSGIVYQNARRGGIETIELSDHAPLGATIE